MGINVNKLIQKMFDSYRYCLEKDDCKDLSEDIVTIINETSMFNTPLQEWINGKRIFTDVKVNGFSLVELAYRLDNDNPKKQRNIAITAGSTTSLLFLLLFIIAL